MTHKSTISARQLAGSDAADPEILAACQARIDTVNNVLVEGGRDRNLSPNEEPRARRRPLTSEEHYCGLYNRIVLRYNYTPIDELGLFVPVVNEVADVPTIVATLEEVFQALGRRLPVQWNSPTPAPTDTDLPIVRDGEGRPAMWPGLAYNWDNV